MFFNPFMFPCFLPLPNNCSLPPTLYSIMQSKANYGKEDQTKIKDLAKNTRASIFDFDYPLSSNVNREEFEILILKKFMMRRINFDTFTLFKIELDVKLNEIMPDYNLLFDSLNDWNLFQDGENTVRELEDNTKNENSTTSSLHNTSDDTVDNRFSKMPQNQLGNIIDGSYITDFTLTKSMDISDSNGNSQVNDLTDKKVLEKTMKSNGDQIRIYTEFIEKKQHIYSMIFNELDILFYQIV